MENDCSPVSIRTVVQEIIRYCGREVDARHPETGDFYHLRLAARRTGLSRTALMKIADGSTAQPDTPSFQKISHFLQQAQPAVQIDEEDFRPDWIELMTLNEAAKPKKEPVQESEAERRERILAQISALMEELK